MLTLCKIHSWKSFSSLNVVFHWRHCQACFDCPEYILKKKAAWEKKTELCRVINSLMKRLCYLYFFYFCFDNILLRQYSVIRKAKSLWGWKLERNCCLIQRVLKCYCTGLVSRHQISYMRPCLAFVAGYW